MAGFTAAEAAAIAAYLEAKLGEARTDPERNRIGQALDSYWRHRARET